MLNVKSIVFFFKRTRISRMARIENFIFRKHRKARKARKTFNLTRITRISRIYFNQNLQNTFVLVETTSLML